MAKNIFKPHHINATAKDLEGNKGVGRYIFLPGSEGRAKEIADHFENVKTKTHHREHTLYLGTLKYEGKDIDVATISSGMGCPSLEIFVHELFNLGAKRFLRIGTAGSLQPNWVKPGEIINVQAAVRDEDTSQRYAPIEVPAVASLEIISSILLASQSLGLSDLIHTGTVHCKSSLYARELGAGPRKEENQAYLNQLAQLGILASEMETSSLFIQSQLYNHQLMQNGDNPQNRVLAGAILAIVGPAGNLDDHPAADPAIKNSITLALETIKILAAQEVID